MDLIDKIVEGCSVVVKDKKYQVLGKAFYVSQDEPNSGYAKVLLGDHYVLVLPLDGDEAHAGKDEGKIDAFDSFGSEAIFDGKTYKLVSHDYQIVTKIDFGDPLEVEGEVEYWDYEADNSRVSVAVVSRTKKRADVVAEFIPFGDIRVVFD